MIRIQGYEKQVNAARDHIMKIVGNYNDAVKEVVSLDARIHKRIIGARGRHVKQIMEDYKVEIKFPRDGDPDPNAVLLIGSEEAVEGCKDHLLNLEEEYLQDVTDAPTAKKPQSIDEIFDKAQSGGHKNTKGFVVKGAPWESKPPKTDSQEDFPDFGLGSAAINEKPLASAWYPNR